MKLTEISEVEIENEIVTTAKPKKDCIVDGKHINNGHSWIFNGEQIGNIVI